MAPRPGRRARSTTAGPRAEEEWIGGRFPAPAYVQGNPPVRPDIVLWVSEDLILGTEVARPEESLEAVGLCLEKVLRQPMMGPSRRPGKIRVADAALAEAVRRVVGDDIPVVVAPTPELERVRDAMNDFMQSSPGGMEPRYLERPDVSPAVMGAFFTEAARLYRTQPWARVPDDSALLELHAPGAKIRRGCVSIIGGAGESYGALLFDDVEGYLALRRLGQREGPPPRAPGVRVFSVNFEPARELSPAMKREVRQHHWTVAGPTAYPVILAVDSDGVPRPVGLEDVVRATVLCGALARYFEGADNTRVVSRHPVTRRFTLELDPAVRVMVRYPHPDAPGIGEADLMHSEGLVNAFVEDGLARGEDEAWAEQAVLACGALLSFRSLLAERVDDAWEPELVEAFLLEFFPALVPVTGPGVALVPRVLRAFFAWLCRAERLSAQDARRLDATVRRVKAEFLARAADATRFSPPKVAALGLLKDGVGPADPRFFESLASAFLGDQGPAPSAKRPRASASAQTPKPAPAASRGGGNQPGRRPAKPSRPAPDKGRTPPPDPPAPGPARPRARRRTT